MRKGYVRRGSRAHKVLSNLKDGRPKRYKKVVNREKKDMWMDSALYRLRQNKAVKKTKSGKYQITKIGKNRLKNAKEKKR